MVKKTFERVGTYFYLLPEYAQAKKVIWDNIDNDGFRMLDHIPRDLIANINATELKITLKNRSILQLIGADTFSRSGVGTNPIGAVFSEFPIMRPEVWDFIRPILAVNGGWALFNGTPRGQNHAFRLYELAKTNPLWFTETLTVEDTGILSPEDIERERLEGMSQAMIDQEFYCKWIENATNFFKYINQVSTALPEDPNPLHFYQMGVDVAKYQDYTVISVIDLNTFKQVHIERFNQMDWSYQKARIEAVYWRFGAPLGFIDATNGSVGDPITEDLHRRGVMLEPFKFTERSRSDLLTNLNIKMEQRIVELLDDPILKAELGYFQYELSGQGKLKVKVPDGLHDDTVMATALSVWNLPHTPLRQNRMQNAGDSDGAQPLYPEFGF